MINKYAEINERVLLYNAMKGILRIKMAATRVPIQTVVAHPDLQPSLSTPDIDYDRLQDTRKMPINDRIKYLADNINRATQDQEEYAKIINEANKRISDRENQIAALADSYTNTTADFEERKDKNTKITEQNKDILAAGNDTLSANNRAIIGDIAAPVLGVAGAYGGNRLANYIANKTGLTADSTLGKRLGRYALLTGGTIGGGYGGWSLGRRLGRYTPTKEASVKRAFSLFGTDPVAQNEKDIRDKFFKPRSWADWMRGAEPEFKDEEARDWFNFRDTESARRAMDAAALLGTAKVDIDNYEATRGKEKEQEIALGRQRLNDLNKDIQDYNVAAGKDYNEQKADADALNKKLLSSYKNRVLASQITGATVGGGLGMYGGNRLGRFAADKLGLTKDDIMNRLGRYALIGGGTVGGAALGGYAGFNYMPKLVKKPEDIQIQKYV